MKVIPEPALNTRTVILLDHKGPLLKGNGPLSYTCGTCGNTLLRNIDFKQVQDMVIKCGACESFNEIPAAHHSN